MSTLPLQAPRLDGRAWLYLALLAVLWSISFVFIRVAAEELPVATLVLLRVGIAALVLNLVVMLSARRYPRQPAVLLRYLVMGLLNNVLPFALIIYATLRIGAGAAAILNATAPIFALLVAHVATRDEKITARKLAGILLGVGGVAAMAGPQALAGLGGELVPLFAMLGATFCYGLSAVYGRSFGTVDPIVSATCQLSAATLVLLPIVLIHDDLLALSMPSATVLAAVLGLALFSTAFAYVIFYALIARAGGMNTMLVTLLIPVGGVTLAWAMLGEAFTPAEAAGMIFIGLGLVVIDGRAVEALRRRRTATPAP